MLVTTFNRGRRVHGARMFLIFREELLEGIIDPLHVIDNGSLADESAGVTSDGLHEAVRVVRAGDPSDGSVNATGHATARAA
jgi:hypothetical protein